ncbi:hypothetical protein Pla110_01600 [Polystyrenella longa]|uniref:DUF4328 domain-containing protein n=1 Tax=Polystyrenella longa TaxID=2528007 RepID=A0A518CGU8_9PLAN|nr:DUF4328 domain-containing protein [Polystyrenella longa]QDU78456.1 hypothetical protein Pla110_01600 [Polystyrenella longa]
MANPRNYTYNDISKLTTFTVVTILIRAVGVLVMSSLSVYHLMLVENKGQLDSRTLVVENLVVVSALCVLLLLLLNFLVYLVWIYRVCKNAHALSLNHPVRFSPGWAVGWYFVPIANIFKPPRVMAAIWSNSSPDISREGSDDSNQTINLWWALWILTSVVNQVSANENLAISTQTTLTIVALGMDLCLCYLWINIVRQVQSMQQEKFAIYDNLSVTCSACGEPIVNSKAANCEMCGEPVPASATTGSDSFL